MISSSDMARFARDLSGLLQLGYTLEEAVSKAAECQTTEVAGMAQTMAGELQKGQTLAAALKPYETKHPLFVRLVSGAEEGERLEDGLKSCAEILEDLADRRLQTFLTVLYPTVVFTLVYAGSAFLIAFGGDLFKELFLSMNISLPPATRVLIGLSDFVSSPLGLIVVLLPLLALWCLVLGKTPIAGWLYRVPIYGRWLKHQESIMFLSTASQLVEQGTPLSEACDVAATVCARPLQESLGSVSEQLLSGDSLSSALEKGRIVPEMAVWAIAQRENAGTLRLGQIARLLQRELDRATHTGNLIFEPILFLVLFFGIGFFITAIFLPLYQLIGNLG